jgi:hypothetical protein
MKRTTRRIVEKLPNLEDKIVAHESVLLAEEALQSLDKVDQTFLKLAWFFENPEEANFNLTCLYQNLDDDWLEWALELITLYFSEDTYLIKKPSYSIIRDGSEYVNQSHFADYLNENGLTYTRQKINNYLVRGKIPEADVEIDGTKYWKLSTVKA